MTPQVAESPVLQARGLVKSYGHVRALDGADLEVMPGQILALVGDNGAGKSTLVKTLCGAVRADAGTILYKGQQIAEQTVRNAQGAGIEVVYQDLALAPDLDITDNLYLGREVPHRGLYGRLGGIHRRYMREAAHRVFEEVGLHGFPALNTPVRELSGGQQQAVAVARAVMWAKSLIAMDEPTAALGVRQTAIVYELIEKVAERGLSVLVISHDIPKMLTVSHTMAVMRHGRVSAVVESRDTSMTEVIGIMLGDRET